MRMDVFKKFTAACTSLCTSTFLRVQEREFVMEADGLQSPYVSHQTLTFRWVKDRVEGVMIENHKYAILLRNPDHALPKCPVFRHWEHEWVEVTNGYVHYIKQVSDRVKNIFGPRVADMPYPHAVYVAFPVLAGWCGHHPIRRLVAENGEPARVVAEPIAYKDGLAVFRGRALRVVEDGWVPALRPDEQFFGFHRGDPSAPPVEPAQPVCIRWGDHGLAAVVIPGVAAGEDRITVYRDAEKVLEFETHGYNHILTYPIPRS